MQETIMKIPMGSHVKDVLTGYEGVVSAYAHYLTGCDSVAIKRRELDKDGKVQDPMWVDINRVEVIGPPPTEIQKIIDGNMQSGVSMEDTGGPQDTPPARGDV